MNTMIQFFLNLVLIGISGRQNSVRNKRQEIFMLKYTWKMRICQAVHPLREGNHCIMQLVSRVSIFIGVYVVICTKMHQILLLCCPHFIL